LLVTSATESGESGGTAPDRDLATECVRNPIEWMYYQSDSIQLRDIHNRFGTRSLVKFPTTSILRHKVYLPYIKSVRVVRPLNYVPYIKEVDLLDWLIGPIDRVQAMMSTTRDIEVEDACVLNIQWRNGTLGSMSVTMLTYPKNLEGSITILGENSMN